MPYGLGPFLLVREFLQRLRQPHDDRLDMSKVSIVVVGSTSGEFGEAGHVGKFRPFYFSFSAEEIYLRT